MRKLFLKVSLLSLMTIGASTVLSSCEDYDAKIDGLQSQVDAIRVSLSELQTKIGNGKIITNVTNAADGGITVTLSSGEVLTIGQKGEPGNSWTIGPDGYWYENGKKTEYSALGQKGDTGEQGEPGKNGNTIYFVPNTETGCWDKYENGEIVEKTNISWRPVEEEKTGVTSFFDGTTLKLFSVPTGEKDAQGKDVTTTVTINVGTPVGSLAFIPSKMSANISYPTNDNLFYYISNYISEEKYDEATKDFITQTNLDKSSNVNFGYRINPSDAYVYEYDQAEFINRAISRADGDYTNLLNVVTTKQTINDVEYIRYFEKNNGELYVNATYNNSKKQANQNTCDVAAFKLMNGQTNWTVSDYVDISTQQVTPVLVDGPRTQNNNTAVYFYNRTKALPSASNETDAFVKQFVPLTSQSQYDLVYNGSLDLATLPNLYDTTAEKFISALGIDGVSYKFSLPSEYLADDVQHTNQQWFVALNGSILTVNSQNLTDGLTPAIGRTPIVRIDAFITDNFGKEVMLASAYVKIKITQSSPTTPDQHTPYSYSLPEKDYEYHTLGSTPTMINQMFWQDVNNKIYGVTGLTSSTFWNYYGGTNKNYSVKVTTIKNGSAVTLGSGTAVADQPFALNSEGISCETTLGSGNTQTSNIKFTVDNKVRTQNSYDNIDNKGAQFTVTITIPSNDIYVKGDVIIKQVFYVLDECKAYEFNPNYYAGTVEGKPNVVITKGKVVANSWKLEMNISEVFKMINGQNIFTYFSNVNNAIAIDFSLDPATQPGVQYTQSQNNGLVELTSALTTPYLFVSMKYDVTLANNENCTFTFNIQFLNPFVAGTSTQVELNGNAIGAVSVATASQVLINDRNGGAIYAWSTTSNSLALTSLANDTYKVNTNPTVVYKFVENDAYNTFKGNLDPAATFSLDSTTGVITYNNLGATLIPSYNLQVKATVTFTNLSQVECIIPVLIKGQN